MPKTRNAFALRGLYNLITSNEFMEPEKPIVVTVKISGLDREKLDDSDKAIPTTTLSQPPPPPIPVKDLFVALGLAKRMLPLIRRHSVRLMKYSTHILDRIVEGGADESANQRARRSRELQKAYELIYDVQNNYIVEGQKLLGDRRNEIIISFKREFGDRLRQARLKKGMPVAIVAAKLGMSRVGYSYYENGQREPPLWTLFELSELLGISLDWLFGKK